MPEFPRPQPAPRPLPPAAAISAYRDALLRDAPPEERAQLAASLDPEQVAWLDLFHAAQREGAIPDAAFIRRLDRIVAEAPGPASAALLPEPLRPLRLSRSHAVNGHRLSSIVSAAPRKWPWFAPRQILQHAGTAALIVILLVGTLFAALVPLLGRDRFGLPLFAPEHTPAKTTLLDLTLTDVPPFRAEGGMAVTDYPPGTSSLERAAQWIEVFYIAAGPMTMRVQEATDPVRVIPPHEAGTEAPDTLLAAGQETVLATGATVMAPAGAVMELLNSGSAPTKMLDLLWSTSSASTEFGSMWQRGFGGVGQNLSSSLSINLRQISLEAGAVLPALATIAVSQSASVVDSGRRADVRLDPDGTIRNGGEQPLELYVLNVANDAPDSMVAPEKLSGQLEFLWEAVGETTRSSHTYGLGVDSEGRIWSADNEDRFQVVAPDGTFLETWGTSGTGAGEFEFLSKNSAVVRHYGDIAFDSEGNIYVADSGNTRIQKFAPDRTFLLAWGSEGEDDGQFLSPSAIAIGPDGVVYVCDDARADIQKFDRDGRYLGTIGEFGFDEGRFMMPSGVAVDSQSEVWVADYNNMRIQHFNASGEFVAAWGQFGSDDGQFNKPNDVAVDEWGRVYVADDFNNRLQVFDAEGRFLAKISDFGGDRGQLSDPLGVAAGDDGTVYVTDGNGVQAFHFTISGE